MKKILLSVFCLMNYCTYSQIDTPSKEGKRITDSLSKVHNRVVIGYTTINGKITHIQHIKNGREYELSLVGFQLDTFSTQTPNRTTNRAIYLYGNR